MAKAIGISSQFRGKIGNVIGYLAKNRAGRNEQIVKSYQPVVANPQSYAQALARVPVGPVQRVCSALLPIIQRGFEGVAYGEPSKTEFLSYNLKYFRGPFMPKGTVMVPPGVMLISKGSLRAVSVAAFEDNVNTTYVEFTLEVAASFEPANYKQLAEGLMTKNSWLSWGEQLTFVIVTKDNDEYLYYVQSIYLDKTNTRTLDGIFRGCDASNNHFTLYSDDAGLRGYIVAAACVRSQPYGESSFKRSTSIISCNPLAYLYNDDAAVQAAVASYRTGEDPEDWEDDPTPEYQQLAYLCMVTITSDMVTQTSQAAIQGKQCLGYVTKGGEMGVFYFYYSTYQMNLLIDAKAKPIVSTVQGSQVPVQYNSAYQPAREYSSIYGTL